MKTSQELQDFLIMASIKRFGRINLMTHLTSIESHFTYDDGMISFWFNTPDKSSHIAQMDTKHLLSTLSMIRRILYGNN